MALLPPVGWADVATKHDLAALEQRMDLRFEAMEHKFGAKLSDLRADLTSELHAALRTQTWSILGVLVVALVISEVIGRLG